MTLSGSASYYMQQRGVAGSGPGAQTGLQGPPSTGPTMPMQSNIGGSSVGSTFQVESSSTISPHGVNVSVPSGVPTNCSDQIYSMDYVYRKIEEVRPVFASGRSPASRYNFAGDYRLTGAR
uniref:Uncharacterized protein n=1 Tax=Nelumbo nucifera TaxID=4432 RepID=A0A822ZWD3_NELNU|nr:TPA_asm: hypothetical protein HUJ06_017779 [Nelumbo nucifera]